MSRLATRHRAALLAARCAAALLLLLLLPVAVPASAQVAPHPPLPDSQVPPPPAGAAAIRGTVSDPSAPGATALLDVALYALRADGSPGIARAKTDAAGRFTFDGLSAATDVVYLVGVRYAGVPYGERVGFAAGQSEIEVSFEVARPTERSAALRVISSTIGVEWRGTRLAISEEHQIANAGRAVVLVAPDRRDSAPPPFAASLPAGHEGFEAPLGGADDGFAVVGDEVSYFGPIYTGEQTIRFGYWLPVDAGDESVALELRPPALGTGSFSVRTPESGPEITSPELSAPRSVDIDGRSFRILETGALAASKSVTLTVAIPETTNDLGSVRLGSTEVTAELDDTVLTVTQIQRLIVAPDANLAGSPDAPLLRFTLPADANLEGLSSDAASLGIEATPSGIDVLGPLGPGEHEFAVRYRVPAPGGVATLGLRFPLEVPKLSVSVADTGLEIDAPRLHRLRPRQMGTRTWLLREAFHVEPSETVSVRFATAHRQDLSGRASLGLVLGAGALLVLFVVSPLRTRATALSEPAQAPASRERELVYATIRDLDHDHETGKLADDDHAQMRAELRAQAIELLRAERAGGAAPDAPAPSTEARSDEAFDERSDSLVRTGRFCPGCAGTVAPDWTFCSHCGGRLAPALSRDEPAA